MARYGGAVLERRSTRSALTFRRGGGISPDNPFPRRGPGRPDRVDFDASYAGTPPWDIGRPQAAFVRLAEAGSFRESVLDVGCGTGEHALLAASLGLEAMGVDSSPTAIGLAERKAADRNLTLDFRVWDALDLPALGKRFETVLDCGLFHVFDDEDRARYVDSLRGAVPSGARYYMLCFSDRVPPGIGPRRVSRDEIEASFAEAWEVSSVEAVTLEVKFTPAGIQAWLASIRRI